jgi:hypothetical protein
MIYIYMCVCIIVHFLFVILTCIWLVSDWDILVLYCYYIHNRINHLKVTSKLDSPTSRITYLPPSNQSVIQFSTKFRGTVLCNLMSLKTEHWTPYSNSTKPAEMNTAVFSASSLHSVPESWQNTKWNIDIVGLLEVKSLRFLASKWHLWFLKYLVTK